MKQLLFLTFIVCVQISFAQYTFKYESNITELEELDVENHTSNDPNASNVSGVSQKGGYYSKMYKTNFGDTLAIMPKIAIIVKNADDIDLVIKQFGNSLSLKNKVGRVFVFNCNVQNSDEVLGITTTLSKDYNVIGCDAFTNARMESLNTLYSKQYYLHNSSSGSIGINMESAWEIASVCSDHQVTVAVIDEGVDHNHEDLPNVLDGYTVGDPLGKGDPVNPDLNNQKAHGVACAGIIGAADNSTGIRGIAANAKILPVNVCPNEKYADDEHLAEAINWASERADVLSCSWGRNGTASIILTEAIKDALTKGRNGKGCVVAFASGNYAQSHNGLAFPASVEGVISVGAVDKNGKIWNYSQRGSRLSLVAPSGNGSSTSDIVTTDRMGSLGYNMAGNYTEHFGGTSAACPQVAGVAALLLSIRPDLTAEEVKNVLQNTATDLGSAGYDTTYGHGLLNAHAAVKEVALSISGPEVAKSKSTFRIENYRGNATVFWNVEEKDKNKIKLTISGEGNKVCTAELNGTKTVRTLLTAVVKVDDVTVATLTKHIALLGTFSGVYSVPSTTINGVSFPAIVNRPFTAGSTLEAHAGTSVSITSDDLYYYVPSWSGNRIENWKVGLNTLSFSYPKTATSTTTVLEFKGSVGGTARVRVLPIQPPHSINVSHDGGVLSVVITNEGQKDNAEYEVEDNSELSATESYSNVWTIEVIHVATGLRQDIATTSTGEYQFNTSTWQSDNYLVRASNGSDTISKKITIK